MNIKFIDNKDPLLKQVVSLGKRNAKTLGMFPEGAFIDHAKKKWIIVVFDKDQIIGYLLFRINKSKQIISIAHLCIDDSFRNQGIAKELLNYLCNKFQHLLTGIRLSCREDYIEASSFYKKYGFVPLNSRRSRSKEENYLINWYYDFGNKDLFTQSEVESSKIKVTLDANILIKLRDNKDNSEVEYLNADWLQDEVEFYYSKEIFNEISRDKNKDRAKLNRAYIQNFNSLKTKPEEVNRVFKDLVNILNKNKENDISDKKHLSECIVSDVNYFVTLDKELLSVKEDVYNKYGVNIFRPSELILYIDQLLNKSNYNAVRLAGVNNIDIKQIEATDIENICNLFISSKNGEKKDSFRKILENTFVNIEKSYVKTIKNRIGEFIGIIAGKVSDNEIIIPLIRVNIKSKNSEPLFSQLINDLLSFSNELKLNKIIIIETFLNNAQIEILESYGFEKKSNEYVKYSHHGQIDFWDLLNLKPEFIDVETTKERMENMNSFDQNIFKLNIERKLYPAKVLDIDIPTYIVPIRPFWASQLFDFYQSNQTLFGANNSSLIWQRDNVYYRNVKPVSEIYPSRILWYISSEKNSGTGRQKGIIACSYLDEVYVDEAKVLYQKFKNFGIYTWDDICKLAKHDISKELKALKFSDTEVFSSIIPFEKISEILVNNNRSKNTFTSPLEVSKDVFNQLYKIGKKL